MMMMNTDSSRASCYAMRWRSKQMFTLLINAAQSVKLIVIEQEISLMTNSIVLKVFWEVSLNECESV